MLSALKNQFRAWLFRPKIESGTITLDQRRIFILPTRRGLGFALVLVLMLLGDINYNLSLGYVLTFLLATLAVLSMLHAFVLDTSIPTNCSVIVCSWHPSLQKCGLISPSNRSGYQ